MKDEEFIKRTTAAFRAQREARDVVVAKIILITTAAELEAERMKLERLM